MTVPEAPFDVVAQLAALRRYARSLARDEADAEDLVHDALVRAYEKRASFRPGRNLRNWLLSILHNSFIDGRRRQRSEGLRQARIHDAAETGVGPGQDHAVRLAQLRRAFMALPEEQRAALHLVTVEGLSYQEAAATLAIPVGTLMSRLGRARASLRAFENAAAPPAGAAGLPRLRVVGGSDEPND